MKRPGRQQEANFDAPKRGFKVFVKSLLTVLGMTLGAARASGMSDRHPSLHVLPGYLPSRYLRTLQYNLEEKNNNYARPFISPKPTYNSSCDQPYGGTRYRVCEWSRCCLVVFIRPVSPAKRTIILSCTRQ
jgi:hypothetical protein